MTPIGMAKGALVLGAIAFAVIGVGFLVVPVRWANVVEISLPTAMARTDLRATYGGFCLTTGVFLWLCASREIWLRPGIVAFGLAGAGFGGGRILGMLIEGTARPLMLGFAAIEVSSALLAWYLVRKLP